MASDNKVLLVQPRYYTKFAPLGLLKLASLHRSLGREVRFQECEWNPDMIEVTSLWTWEYQRVHDTIMDLKLRYPDAYIRLGGIYATLMPEHAKTSGADEIVQGIVDEAEDLMPAYDLVPEWKKSMIFTTRGCVNRCAFCAVPKMEGDFKQAHSSIKNLIYTGHNEILILDNNILASDYFLDTCDELAEVGLIVDFNQGLDFKLLDREKAKALSKVKVKFYRTALDLSDETDAFEQGIHTAKEAGLNLRSKGMVYLLYNFNDDPDDFLFRLKFCLDNAITAYPMRYQPLRGIHALKKNSYIDSGWTEDELDRVEQFRRKVGNRGAIVPNEITKKLVLSATDFESATTPYEKGEWCLV